MCFQQAVIIFLAAAISLCTATAIKCDADLTTKFAIGKRQMEKQLDCRMDKENIAKCDDVNEVNKAWQTFEEINDQYSKAISDCKITQRLKRRRTIDCGCTQRKEEVGYERVKRSCGCGQDRHHGSAGVNHHRHATEETEDAMNEAEEMMAVSSHRMRRHRHRNAPELQKHERGKHGRAHVPHRHGHKSAAKKHGAHRRRHDHGSNDDPKEKEQVPDAHDRSKTAISRTRRGSCILQGKSESDRLEAKYSSLCDRSQICDKENLHGEQKKAMNELSKKRQRIYREYLSAFDRCYGSVMHS